MIIELNDDDWEKLYAGFVMHALLVAEKNIDSNAYPLLVSRASSIAHEMIKIQGGSYND
jgi:hypothetical protein